MSSDFTQLIADIEREAREEGPRAVRELERFREEFGLASVHVGTINDATITALLRPLGKRIQLVDNSPITARRVGGGRTQTARRTSPAQEASRRRKSAAGKTTAKVS